MKNRPNIQFFEVFAGCSGPVELKIGFSEAYRCPLHMCERILKKKSQRLFLGPLKTFFGPSNIRFLEFFEVFVGCSGPVELKIGSFTSQ